MALSATDSHSADPLSATPRTVSARRSGDGAEALRSGNGADAVRSGNGADAVRSGDAAEALRSGDRAGLLISGDGGRIRDLEALVEEARSFLARFAPERHPVDDVRRAMALFSTLGNLSTAGLALGAPRLARAAGPSSGRRSVAEDLATITGSSLSEAHRLLSVGEASRTSSGVEGALREGELSRERAAIVSEGLAVAPGAADELLTAASSESFRGLRDRQRHAKARARRHEDDRARAARHHRARRLHTFVDDDGFYRVDAHLPPEAGARLGAQLDAEVDRLLARLRQAGPGGTPEERDGPEAMRADALCSLFERGDAWAGHDDGIAAAPGTPVSPVSPAPLVSAGPSGPTGTTVCPSLPGPRAAITLRVDLAALRRGELGEGEVCEIPGVGAVPLTVARALLGDAVVDLVIARGVDVTTTAHLGRTVPAALRRALAERDGGCVVPGCGATWTLEVDHWRLPYAEGGEASLDNLVVLCRFHHHLRHYRGFTLAGGPGRWRFEAPGSGSDSGALDERGPPRHRPSDDRPARTTTPQIRIEGAVGDQETLFGDRE